jgi:hypothetical protein
MPVILAPGDYDRWLGEEPDPRSDGPYPAKLISDVTDLDAAQ